MWPYLLAGGIAATGSLVNGLVNRWKDKRDQKEMMQYQNEINLRNWSLQNQYNTPSAQMQRLKDAGLNPNLIYQSGGAVSQAGEIAAPSSSSFSQPTFPESPFSQYIDLMAQEIDRKSLDNETKSVEAQAEYATAMAKMTDKQKEMIEKELGYKDRFLEQQVAMNNYRMLVDFQTARHLESQTGINQRDLDTYYMRLENTLENDRVQRMIGRAGIAEIEKKIQQINTLMTKTNQETKLLQLQYARDAIAKKVEQMTYEWSKAYSKADSQFTEDFTGNRSNLFKQLDQEIDLISKEILGKSISNISNPFRDILLPVGLFMLTRGKTPVKIKGFGN